MEPASPTFTSGIAPSLLTSSCSQSLHLPVSSLSFPPIVNTSSQHTYRKGTQGITRMATRFLPDFSTKSKPYFSLPQAEDGSSEPLQSPSEKTQQPSRLASIFPSKALTFWIFMSLFFASTTTWLTAELHAVRKQGSFAKGFRGELDAAKHLIEVKTIPFKGSPRFKDDGTEYVPEAADGEEHEAYVGTPRREIDHNWALLHWGRFFLLTEEEAKSAWGDEYKEFWSPQHGGYVAALEVMHTLHCLDHIRKAFYPNHYPIDSEIHGVLHRDHCLDHLRQTVLCQADLTPIPSRYFKSLGQNYIDSDRQHTCRDFSKIREWVSERFNGSLRVQPAPGTVVKDEWRTPGGPSGGVMGMHHHGNGHGQEGHGDHEEHEGQEEYGRRDEKEKGVEGGHVPPVPGQGM